MIYLSVGLPPDLPKHPRLGRMLSLMKRNLPTAGGLWAADNGCFATPERYTDAAYLAWLDRLAPYRDCCLFATAPDVLGDAAATLDRSAPVLPLIRALGYPAALVAQDGLESVSVPWDAFDCLFVGGTTAWKLSEAAYALARDAKARGKWTHMGRVNGWPRFKAASMAGYDSADGTHLAFRPNRYLPQVLSWLDAFERQPLLWEDTA